MIESALYELLHNDTAVAAIVGDRIYPLVVPQRTAPSYPAIPKTYVTYQRISGVRNMPLNGPNGFVVARYQVNSFAYNFELVGLLADSIRLKLDGYRGDTGGHRIQRIWLDGDSHSYEYETDATETAVFQVIQDYRIAYAEAQAA
jgi:hypothetical protein